MTETVWLEAWQFSCCGEPARVGELVTWWVREHEIRSLASILGPSREDPIRLSEEHHSDPEIGLRHITGLVTGIRELTYVHEPDPDRPGQARPRPGSGELTYVHEMDPSSPRPRRARDEHTFAERPAPGRRRTRSRTRGETWTFAGWVVELDGVRDAEPDRR